MAYDNTILSNLCPGGRERGGGALDLHLTGSCPQNPLLSGLGISVPKIYRGFGIFDWRGVVIVDNIDGTFLLAF